MISEAPVPRAWAAGSKGAVKDMGAIVGHGRRLVAIPAGHAAATRQQQSGSQRCEKPAGHGWAVFPH